MALSKKLDVRGHDAANVRVQRWGAGGSGGDFTSLDLIKTADTTGNFMFQHFWAGSGTSGKIGFGKYASTPWNGVQMVLDTSNGRVGLGTDAPAGMLHVNSASGNPDVVFSGATDATLKVELQLPALLVL